MTRPSAADRGGPPRQAATRPVKRHAVPPARRVEGRLGRIDDFIVTLILADGTRAVVSPRSATCPRVDIRDPLEAHKKTAPIYTDTDMHNVTAYLVTLK